MSITINLKFTPVEDYFFGKENKDKKGNDNYFLRSQYMPQVTTVLGSIRFWLLMATDNFANGTITDKKKAASTIGKASFSLSDEEFKLGQIEQVSNLYLRDKKHQKFIPAPLWLDKEGKMFSRDENTQCPVLPGYSPKNYYPPVFTNGTDEVPFDAIFKERVNSHNRKNAREENDEDAYFKTQTFNLLDDYTFGVTVTLTGGVVIKEEPFYLKVGGENKLFRVEVINDELKSDEEILKKYPNNKYYKLILTSDAFLSGLDKKNYHFGIIQTKSFRSLYSHLERVRNYYAIENGGESFVRKSSLLQLIEGGSVFYFLNESEANSFIIQYLQNECHKNAGFNHYVLLKPANQQ